MRFVLKFVCCTEWMICSTVNTLSGIDGQRCYETAVCSSGAQKVISRWRWWRWVWYSQEQSVL